MQVSMKAFLTLILALLRPLSGIAAPKNFGSIENVREQENNNDLSAEDINNNVVVTEVVSQQDVFTNGQYGYNCFRIPAIVRHPAHPTQLIAMAEGRVRSCADNGKIDLVTVLSIDGGQTWSEPSIALTWTDPLNSTTVGNPTLIADSIHSRLVLVYCINNTAVLTSQSEDGRVWIASTNITDSIKPNSWGWIATGPGHGIEVDGVLLVPFNKMLRDAKVTYQSTIVSSHSEDPRIHWGSQMTQQVLAITDVLGQDTFTVTFDDGPVDTYTNFGYVLHGNRPGLLRSYDGGMYCPVRKYNPTWHRGGFVPNVIANEGIIERMGGTRSTSLLYSIRKQPNQSGCRYFSVSNDGMGDTWSEPFAPIVADLQGHVSCIPDPMCQGSLLFVPIETLFQRGIILVTGPTSRWSRNNLALYASLDGGLSYIRALQLNNGPAAYSDIVLISPDFANNSIEVGIIYESQPTTVYTHVRIRTSDLIAQWQTSTTKALLREAKP